MRPLLFAISVLILSLTIGSCTMHEDSLTEQFPDLVQVDPPGDLPYKEVQLYIENIQIVELNSGKALHVQGNFPNACSHLLRVEGTLSDTTLELNLIGWQETEIMCAQYLTPFSYLYTELSGDQLQAIEKVISNGSEFYIMAPENN